MDLVETIKDVAWFSFIGLIVIIVCFAHYMIFSPISVPIGIAYVIIIILLIIYYSKQKQGAPL
jgi:cobalamin synthase